VSSLFVLIRDELFNVAVIYNIQKTTAPGGNFLDLTAQIIMHLKTNGAHLKN
jgi:hypothetical protein